MPCDVWAPLGGVERWGLEFPPPHHPLGPQRETDPAAWAPSQHGRLGDGAPLAKRLGLSAFVLVSEVEAGASFT